MFLAEKISARLNFVEAKYASAIERYGIDHIDYTKSVSEAVNNRNLVNGKRLVHWREPGKTTASPFFTYEDVDPGTLGIPKTYTEKFYVDLPDEYNFLKTTANDVKAFSKADPGVNGMYNGGGTQLYSEKAAKKATFTPAN
jgi:hypothetical protein